MKLSSPPLENQQVGWLLLAGFFSMVLLLPYLPLWVAGFSLLVQGLRVWQWHMKKPQLPSFWLTLIALAFAAAILAYFKGIFGQHPGVALLVGLQGIKQLEGKNRRDGYVIIFLNNFICMANFIYSQSIFSAIVFVVVVFINLVAMASLVDGAACARELSRLVMGIMAQALPILLFLFLLFPRINGPLWGLPSDAFSGSTGLSNSMSPGSISQLINSDAIVFRARFQGVAPAQKDLYWRGPVLIDFDGRTWRQAVTAATLGIRYSVTRPMLPASPQDEKLGGESVPIATQEFRYEITHERSNQTWVFPLEMPIQLPTDMLMGNDYQTFTKEPITQRILYAAASRIGQPYGGYESRGYLRSTLELPSRGNSKAREIANQWRQQYDNDWEAIVKAATQFFLQQQLTYTLQPPLLGADSVDEFLFISKQGYCEHFASSFVFMLRAAGVPSRIVTGFQGGEINPIDGMMVVRNLDAHAWGEYWLPQRGWQRIDPTAVSAPLRINNNLASAVPTSDTLPLLMRPDWQWLRELRYRWDATANHWNQWVLGYNTEKQLNVLSQLGLPDWRAMTAALTTLCGLTMLLLLTWAMWARRTLDEAQVLWLRLCQRLAQRGLPRQLWEGPQDYCRRIANLRPDLALAMQSATACYMACRYGKDSTAIAELATRIKAIKP